MLSGTAEREHKGRLAALRTALAGLSLDGFILSTGDEHLSEFPADYARRLAWLTGFKGSTASIAVLGEEAAIFVDGRYTEVVQTQVDRTDWSREDVPRTSVGGWLADRVNPGARVGYDPRLYTRSGLQAIADRTAPRRIELVPLSPNPLDALWADQPARPDAKAFIQPLSFAGATSADKRRRLGDWLASVEADVCVLSALDSIAWLFNIRGRDIAETPVVYAHALCFRDGTAELFIDEAKLSDAVRRHLGRGVTTRPYEGFHDLLAGLGDTTASVDPAQASEAVFIALERSAARIRHDRDPTLLPRAVKNPVEIQGMRQAHIRDGVALTRFLHWFAREAPFGRLTERSAASALNSLRRATDQFHSLAFDPVSAVDAHAAIPHYCPSEDTDALIGSQSIYLIDSGGQYQDGTTDVTRTVAVGSASEAVKTRFTQVLKGYIALETLVFPSGTLGSRLECFARASLWAGGVDCIHGIGHGVGHFLNVHEGPARLGLAHPGEAGLEAGMILSNEPGYYKPGAYGIRIENLMVVVVKMIDGAEAPMLGFEPITLAPIDRNLIEPSLLTADEAAWLDAYHARVRACVGPHLSLEESAWLADRTAPIRGGQGA